MADVGRPTVMTPQIIALLEEAFSWGCSDIEACLHANIGKTALYEYQKDHPEFTERKEELKENPILKARKSVVNALDDDSELALKYLERRKKDEFSTRAELDHAHTFTQMPSVKVGKAEIQFNVGEEK